MELTKSQETKQDFTAIFSLSTRQHQQKLTISKKTWVIHGAMKYNKVKCSFLSFCISSFPEVPTAHHRFPPTGPAFLTLDLVSCHHEELWDQTPSFYIHIIGLSPPRPVWKAAAVVQILIGGISWRLMWALHFLKTHRSSNALHSVMKRKVSKIFLSLAWYCFYYC